MKRAQNGATSGKNSPAPATTAGLAQHPPRPMHGARVLHAEDNVTLRELCQIALAQQGYEVVSVDNGAEAWRAIAKQDFDLVITDHDMPDCSGSELISKMRHAHIHWPVIVTTGHPDFYSERVNQWLGVETVLAKPFHTTDLLDAITRALWGETHLLPVE